MFRYKSYVYEIYKERSFSKAAQNLYISQPSLSARIKMIEDRLGSPIFDRSTSPLRLTELGEAYIKAAEDIFKVEQQMENYINDMNTLKSGHLSIGASNVFAAYALPGIIGMFKNKFPDVNIRLTEGNTATLEEQLANNTLDMVIDNNHYDSGLYDKELYSRELILLCVPRTFSVTQATRQYQISEDSLHTGTYASEDFPIVPLKAFEGVPFVMLTQSNDTRTRGDKLTRAAGFRPRIALELNQQATAYMTSSTGMGAAFVSDVLAAKLPIHENLAYYKLGGDEAKRDVYFYYKKRKFKTKAMEEFIRLITNI